jgi:hypothetical protein
MIPIGILAASGAGLAGSYHLLSTTILTTTTASVTFSSLNTLAAGYQHLQIRAVVTMASGNYVSTQFNGVTSGYRYHQMANSGSSVSSISDTGAAISTFIGYNDKPAAAVIDILDPFNASKNTTQKALAGVAPNNITFSSGLFASTSAITSITLLEFYAGSFAAGSRFSLYGLKVA